MDENLLDDIIVIGVVPKAQSLKACPEISEEDERVKRCTRFP
jgi:hypothetical protein